MPVPVLKSMSSPFLRFSTNTEKMFPKLKYQLEQANLGIDVREYGAIMIFLVLFYTVFIGGLATLLLSRMTEHFWSLGITIGLVMGLLMLFQIIMYPQILTRKKTRSVEKNLVFALRAILVQLKSGVSLFDSMSMVSQGSYGTVSEEFKKTIDEMNTGTPQQDALQMMSERNPSPYLRKAIWQMVNGMNAGADISSILNETVSSMIREQKIAINKYGSQLRVLSLMYMMMGVIIPALGVTLLIVLFTFPMVGEALERQPALNDVGAIMKTYVPSEVYTQGQEIWDITGRQELKGQDLTIRIDQIEGKRAIFTLLDEEGTVVRSESVYGEGSNLRDYFLKDDKSQYFGESLYIKFIGQNFFGQSEVHLTRFEPTHLIFWGFLALTGLMQFMYIGFIKSRRPSIIG